MEEQWLAKTRFASSGVPATGKRQTVMVLYNIFDALWQPSSMTHWHLHPYWIPYLLDKMHYNLLTLEGFCFSLCNLNFCVKTGGMVVPSIKPSKINKSNLRTHSRTQIQLVKSVKKVWAWCRASELLYETTAVCLFAVAGTPSASRSRLYHSLLVDCSRFFWRLFQLDFTAKDRLLPV